jgi:hypothetical protein
MLPKFFYSHTFKSQVLKHFLGFLIVITIIKSLHYGARIFIGFVHIGILLHWSIWWILKRRGSVRRRLDNEHVEENVAKELVQLVDFEEEG